jgi:deoxyribodipyrimidine photo-lyase
MRIFIFRRDFRILDNLALNHILNLDSKVLPIFIFNPNQIKDNPYFGDKTFEFMYQSLKDLEKAIHNQNGKLYYFYGDDLTILKSLVNSLEIESISFNQDVSNFSKIRDKKITDFCKSINLDCFKFKDYNLYSLDKIKPYKRFTYFYNFCMSLNLQPKLDYIESKNKFYNLYLPNTIDHKEIQKFYTKSLNLDITRKYSLKILKNSDTLLKDYDYNRNFLNYKTSGLSPYIKYGLISIRQVFLSFKNTGSSELIRQLLWREFCDMLEINYKIIQTKSEKSWENNPEYIKAWKSGLTGFPIIDAGIRELNLLGTMHNRLRILSCQVLTKHLSVSWEIGEKHFAENLIDYYPSVNAYNWKTVSNNFLVKNFMNFNIWKNSEKFDKDCQYIRKWVNQISDYSNHEIHNFYKYHKGSYKPIIDIQ